MDTGIRRAVAVLCAALLGGCAALGPTPAQRVEQAARDGRFQPVATINGPLKAWLRAVPNLSAQDATRIPLTVYIEGDGAEWPALRKPPDDPTPINALTLRLALRDAEAHTAYLGRPCQYLDADALAQCSPRLWIRARYGDEALTLMNDAIDTLLREVGAQRLRLVGYSGGGVIAALLAARREDVSCLVTIAAPLDTHAWTAALKLSTLSQSLNPLDFASQIAGIAQTHFAGNIDEVVPPAVYARVMDALPGTRVVVLDAFDHDCCWVHAWEKLRSRTCLAQP